MGAEVWDAVILTGGTARRLGGVDKATLEVGGRRLIDRVLDAMAGAGAVVVVGPPVATDREVRFVREEPAYGGPAAGALTGAAAVDGDQVVVLAVDLPFVSAATVERLLAAAAGHDGAVLVDDGGRRQPAFVVRRAALAAVAPDQPHGLPLRTLLAPLDLAEVRATTDESRDIDTSGDLEACDTPGGQRNLGS